MNPTLAERQAELRQQIQAKKKAIAKQKEHARKKRYVKKSTLLWREQRTKKQQIRARWEARRAVAAEKRRIKAERKRLREEAKKRKLRDPIAEAARISREAFQAGVQWGIEEGKRLARSEKSQ